MASECGVLRRSMIVLIGLCLFHPPLAQAQTAAEQQRAKELFKEGRALFADPAKLAEACRKFEESDELARAGETLMNLAECHRRQGKTATAWRELGEAMELAKKAKFDMAIKVAGELRYDLEKQLSHLTVGVDDDTAALPGLVVELDGKPLPSTEWNKPLPLDPAKHTVSATAPGRSPWSTTVELGPNADRKTAKVVLAPLPKPGPKPEPKRAPKPPLAEPPTPLAPPATNKLLVGGFVVGGLGLATTAVSLGLGAMVLDRKKTVEQECDALTCTPTGLDAVASGSTLSTASTALFVAGAVMMAGGATLVILGNRAETTVGVGPGFVTLRGRM